MFQAIKRYIGVTVLFLGSPALAASSQEFGGAPGVDLTFDKVFAILTGLACWFARIAGTLVIGALVVYGLQMVLSRGNPEKFSSARKSLAWAVVGGLVIFGVYTIIATVANAVSGGSFSLLPLSCGF